MKKIKKRMINWNIPIRPCKDSDGEIGVFFISFDVEDTIYGKFFMGIYFGKFMLSYSPETKFDFCKAFATGCGG